MTYTWLMHFTDAVLIFLMLLSLSIMFQRKLSLRKHILLGLLCITVVMLTFQVVDILWLRSIRINMAVYFVVCLIFARLSLYGPFPFQIAVLLFFMASHHQLVIIELSIIGRYPELAGHSFLTPVLLCAVVFILSRHRLKPTDHIRPYLWLSLCVTSGAGMFLSAQLPPLLFSAESSNVMPLISIAVGTWVLNVFLFNFVTALHQAHKRELELQAISARQSHDRQRAQDHEVLYNDLRQLRHELNHHMYVINDLLARERYGQLRDYVRKTASITALNRADYDTGNSIVDAVLSNITSRCEAAGVSHRLCSVQLPSFDIDDTDLCSLLANLLGNALEGTVGAEEPSLQLSIGTAKNYLEVIVTNSTAGDVLRDNPELSTTKEESSRHGIGLKVVRSIVDKYDGHMTCEGEDKWFRVTALLRMYDTRVQFSGMA